MEIISNWLRFLKLLFVNKTLQKLLPGLMLVAAYTTLLIYFQLDVVEKEIKIPTAIHSLLGIVLGLLLVFRTNTAYERWWEGRRLLGAMVNASRNLAIKCRTFIPEESKEDRIYLSKLIGNYAFAMKEHLRDGVKWEEIDEIKLCNQEHLQAYNHVPNRIAGLIYETVNQLYLNKKITNEQLLILDKQMEVLTDVIGGCERIKKTPIPFAYSQHLKKFIFLFILIVPMGFIHELHYWAVPVVMLIFYAFVGLESIGEEIEDPFGTDANDLPTDQIAATIRKNSEEILN